MKSNQLVCEYLENISYEVLEKFQKIIKKYVKGRHGIYALYRKNKLYYVGLATNLRSRLGHHLKDRHAGAWDSFSAYLTPNNQHLREIEALLTRVIDRKGNKQRGKFGKAEDLRRRVWRDIKNDQRVELNNLFGDHEIEEKQTVKRRIATEQTGREPVLAPYVVCHQRK